MVYFILPVLCFLLPVFAFSSLFVPFLIDFLFLLGRRLVLSLILCPSTSFHVLPDSPFHLINPDPCVTNPRYWGWLLALMAHLVIW